MSSSSSSHRNSQQKKWEHRPTRHYCSYCQVWLGSDKQSILLHENGQKHQLNVQKSMQQQRQSKSEQEKANNLLQQSLQQMEASAHQAFVMSDSHRFEESYDLPNYQQSVPPIPSSSLSYPGTVSSIPPPPPPPPPPPQSSSSSDKKKWNELRKQKEEFRRDKRKSGNDQKGESDDDNDDADLSISIKRRRIIPPSHGHYTTTHDGNRIWLEGSVFGDILEEGMPIQLWTGPILAGTEEKKLIDRDWYWKQALVVAVRKHVPTDPSSKEPSTSTVASIDVSYLESPDATDETLVQSVPLDRVRILLGNPNDSRIPETLEEARLLAMGGEEEDLQDSSATVDEATGLTSWTTVSVKRTTIRQELKEERARLRQKRFEAAMEAERQKKKAEERKMEEAKVANADDSALGAYDVWSRGVKEGYKGIDIHSEVKVEAHELGKKLADHSSKVEFKKPAFKATTKKQNRRKTSADD